MLYMEVNETQKQNTQEQHQKKDESLQGELAKDFTIDVVVDEVEGIANIAIPLEELQLIMKLFKAIDKSINQNKGLTR